MEEFEMSFSKRNAAFILLASVGLLLAACETRESSLSSSTSDGGSGSSSEAPPRKILEWYDLPSTAELDPTQDITIRFWHRMGAQSQLIVQRWINEFKDLYPNVTVLEEKVATDYGALSDKVALSITAGGEPDIVESYPDHVARYVQAQAPLALNNFINHPTLGWSEEEIEDFLPGLWNEGKSYDNAGTVLSLPFTKSSEGFFYNASYFAQHGYEVPTTWDEVFTIAEDIKTREPNAIPFGYDSEDNLFITASKQWGAPYTGYNTGTGRGEVLFNNDDAKAMTKYFKDKVDKGLMITRSLNGDAYTSDIFKTNARLYMYVGSTGGTRYAYIGAQQSVFDAGYRVGVAPLPSKVESLKAQIQQGPNINLLKKDNEQQMIAAWLFAKYMVSPTKSAEFSVPSGYAPARYSAYESTTWTNYVTNVNPNPTTMLQAQDKLVKEAIEMFLNNGDVFFTSAVFNLSSKTRTEVGKLLVKILAYDGNDLDGYIDTQFQDSYDFIVN
jgi:multiple sugar transport system substrate-binding protein